MALYDFQIGLPALERLSRLKKLEGLCLLVQLFFSKDLRIREHWRAEGKEGTGKMWGTAYLL